MQNSKNSVKWALILEEKIVYSVFFLDLGLYYHGSIRQRWIYDGIRKLSFGSTDWTTFRQGLRESFVKFPVNFNIQLIGFFALKALKAPKTLRNCKFRSKGSINDVRIFCLFLDPLPPPCPNFVYWPSLLMSEFLEPPPSPSIRTSLMDGPYMYVSFKFLNTVIWTLFILVRNQHILICPIFKLFRLGGYSFLLGPYSYFQIA